MEKKISVKDLLMQAFLTGWERSDKSISQDEYLQSAIQVIEVLQVVQQVGNLGAGFADAQIGIAAQFLNFRRQGIKAGSDRIGVVQQIIAPRR